MAQHLYLQNDKLLIGIVEYQHWFFFFLLQNGID